MGGTMSWLSGLSGLPQMQFFHTLLPVWLLSAHLAHLATMGHSRMLVILINWGETMATVAMRVMVREMRARVRRATVMILMTMTILLLAPSPSPLSPGRLRVRERARARG